MCVCVYIYVDFHVDFQVLSTLYPLKQNILSIFLEYGATAQHCSNARSGVPFNSYSSFYSFF